MPADMSTPAPHVYAVRKERRENSGSINLTFSSGEELEYFVEWYFIKIKLWQEGALAGQCPVRSHTWRITSHLKKHGHHFSPLRVRNACLRLVDKGVLMIDEDYSAVNSICWRYLK